MSDEQRAPISWDERTGIVTRNWTSKACAEECSIQLQYAPPTSSASFNQFGGMSVTGHVFIHRSPATIYSYRERRGTLLLTEVAFVWTRPDHSRVLMVIGGAVRGQQQHALTLAQAIRLARSIR